MNDLHRITNALRDQASWQDTLAHMSDDSVDARMHYALADMLRGIADHAEVGF